MMQKKRVRFTEMPRASAAAGESPTARTCIPQRVERKNQLRVKASATPTTNNGLISSADLSCGTELQLPRASGESWGAVGWIYGLPK
jgi:hypothetical protein